jgi:4-hydroxythreonine-4-phosphate dehydrogenase
MIPRIAITTGEPAGIGPDLCLQLEGLDIDAELVLIGDPRLLTARAGQLRRTTVFPARDRATSWPHLC